MVKKDYLNALRIYNLSKRSSNLVVIHSMVVIFYMRLWRV